MLHSLQGQEHELKDVTALLYLAVVSWPVHWEKKKKKPWFANFHHVNMPPWLTSVHR